MPKHSLKRRHHRQHDLSLRWHVHSRDFWTRDATAARTVSDEDIQQTSVEMKSPVRDLRSEHQDNLVNRMIRQTSSMKLSELASSQTFDEDEIIIKFSRTKSLPHEKECQERSQPVSPSPWGHFVDMLCPSSMSDELSFSQTHDLSLGETGYVPCCPSPRLQSKQGSRHFHPYDQSSRTLTKRFPLSSQSSPTTKVNGFFLRVPDTIIRRRVQETEDAFLGLSL